MQRRATVAVLLAALAALVATSAPTQSSYLDLEGVPLPLPAGQLSMVLTVDNPNTDPLSASVYWALSAEASPAAELSLSREGFRLDDAGTTLQLSGFDSLTCPAEQVCTFAYTLAATSDDDGDGEVVWDGSLRADWDTLDSDLAPRFSLDQGAPTP